MLTERFPELDRLDAEEKLILAGELWRQATQASGKDHEGDLPEDIVRAIEARLDSYLADPSTGVPWEELKKKLRGDANH